jgi:hypothetical protein
MYKFGKARETSIWGVTDRPLPMQVEIILETLREETTWLREFVKLGDAWRCVREGLLGEFGTSSEKSLTLK